MATGTATATATATTTATSSSSNNKSPPQLPRPLSEITTQQPLQSSPNTPTPETPATDSTPAARPPEPSSTASDVIHIPSYSRWFSWNDIHECEVRFLPEFFDWRSPSKNPRVYKYYRNAIIGRFREHPTRKITFTEARKTIIGDVGSVRRVFDFLEAWGLINYSPSPSKPQLKWEDKENKSNASASQANDPGATSADFSVPKNRLCSGCKSVCSIACFACDKYDLTLCARCYVRAYNQVGVNSTEFRRVEISEEIKSDWTDKETLHLLEAVMHYGDDWKKVAVHVGGRSERECVNRFIKFPFGEQFVGHPDSAEGDGKFYETKDQNDAEPGLQSFAAFSPTKRMRFTPLADASNPIMAQAAFLSALVGVDVAEAAARASVRALAEGHNGTSKESLGSLSDGARHQESYVTSNGNKNTTNTLEGASLEAKLQLEKEEQDLERAISGIIEVQTKEIQDKIVHFEEFELQMEREWQQLQQMKNLLFVDQLTLLFHKAAARRTGESIEENIKTE